MRKAWLFAVVSLMVVSLFAGCGKRTRSDGLKESFIPGEAERTEEATPESTSSAQEGGGINVDLDEEGSSAEAETEGSGGERDYTVLLPDLPVVTDSTAFCVIDDSEQVYAAKDMLDRKVPASLTKVLTALIVCENLSLDERVTVTEEETQRDIIVMSSGVSPSLRAGEEFSVRELLCMLMLESTNTAGNVLADAVAGSTEAFAKLMNEKCQELGLTHSHFSNPHGLDADDHYSCAYDLVVLLRNAMSIPELAKIMSTVNYTVPATEYCPERVLTMGHSMLNGSYQCAGAIAGKTGWTVEAKSALLTAFSRNGKNFYVCTLNSDEGMHYQDTENLVNSVYASFDHTTVETIPLTHDVSVAKVDADGVIFRYATDNANAESRYVWWNTQLGTAVAAFMTIGEMHGVNEVRIPFTEPGTYAVQFFGKNSAGQEKGVMVHVLYTGEELPSRVVSFRGQDYIINEDGLLQVGEPEMSYGAYCTDANGAVLKNTITDDGYFAGSNGRLMTGWQDFTGGKYYFQPDGRMATGQIMIDGEVRTFSENGVLAE